MLSPLSLAWSGNSIIQIPEPFVASPWFLRPGGILDSGSVPLAANLLILVLNGVVPPAPPGLPGLEST